MSDLWEVMWVKPSEIPEYEAAGWRLAEDPEDPCHHNHYRVLMEREIGREEEYIADIKRRLRHVGGEDTPLFRGATE